MKRSSWVIQVNPESSDPNILMRDTQGNLKDGRVEGNVKVKAETGEMWPRPRKASSHQNLEEARKNLLQSLRREHSPADTSVPTSGLQNCEGINFCCWCMVIYYSNFRKLIQLPESASFWRGLYCCNSTKLFPSLHSYAGPIFAVTSLFVFPYGMQKFPGQIS